MDLNQFDAALKQYYTSDRILNQVYQSNPLLALMPKMTSFSGRNLPIVTIWGDPQGRSANFARAQARPRKKLTMVHKNNVLTRAGGLWTRTFNEVAKEFPDITTDYLHVDAASMFFVTNPERFDVVVTDNLFGDILTDIAAAICGGIGLAASGNINPTGEFPSMFEPVHGSAPDIAGKSLADPTATVMSVAMMLSHLGLTDAAADIERAVAADLLTRGDAKRSTVQVGDALAAGASGAK